MTHFVIGLYAIVMMALSVYGCLAWVTLILAFRFHGSETHFRDTLHRAHAGNENHSFWPSVTVQLPIFNERDVAVRVIDAAASLDYPRHKLHIQVIDDSTDETAAITHAVVERYQAAGINITWLNRPKRSGYKAGALQAATAHVQSDLIAIFDADFCPQPDFLRQTVPHFAADAQLGFVQARWGHLNNKDGALMAAQAIALDEHFLMGQFVREQAGMVPRFNGSAGVWRRDCIESVGGWLADTVCEDMCLSTRAGLDGWTFRFVPNVVVPAALPTTMTAFKNQQARWAKGALQCLGRYARPIIASPRYTPFAKWMTLVSMSRYCANLLFMMLFLLHVPLMMIDGRPPAWLGWCGVFGMGQLLLLVVPQLRMWMKMARPNRIKPRYIIVLILLAVGMSPSQTRGMLSVLWGWLCGRTEHPFIRTPKSTTYTLPFDWIVWIEFGCALISLGGLITSIATDQLGFLPFWAVCLAGFSYVIGTNR